MNSLKNRLRLAPSPTGTLHIGTARTALFNWLHVKSTNGKFLIRIEDTDSLRSKEEFTKNILEGLQWLGLNWDEEPIKQSERIEIHKLSIQKLLDKGIAYRCFTSENEIHELREFQQKNSLPPRHDNRHRDLTKSEIDSFISEGRTSVIRFKIDDGLEIKWHDSVRGEIKWLGKDLGGDMVLSRRSKGYEIGSPLYNLAVVVDDNHMGITHVIRGEDHISNTAKQILIYKALDFELPIFSHTPLILNPEGKKLSKRDSVTSIDEFKKMGYLPSALVNYMALLGWTPKSDNGEVLTLDEMSKIFKLDDVNKSGAKFNWEKLNWINSQHIKKMPIIDLHNLFKTLWIKEGWNEPSESWGLKLTELLRDSVVLLNESIEQSKAFFVVPEIQKDGKAFIEMQDSQIALKLLYEYAKNRNQKIDKDEANRALKEISVNSSIKKGLLMKSLRVSLFGCLSGPDLIESWQLIAENNLDSERIKRCISNI